jgi:hypothetical protein
VTATQGNEYRAQSFDALLTAVAEGDWAARGVVQEYLRIRTAGRDPIVERDQQRGWRVRDPLAA